MVITPDSSNIPSGSVQVSPSADGMPGAQLAQQLIDWLGQAALFGSLASILLGAAVYGLAASAGNHSGSYKGRQLALAGVVGACLTGIAPAVINQVFQAAN